MDGTTAVPTGAHWGIYDVLVADGRVVGARPWDEDPDPAPLNAGTQRGLRPMLIIDPYTRPPALSFSFNSAPFMAPPLR